MPCAPSICACAIEPAISNVAKRLSKLTDAVYFFTSSATGSLKRPDQPMDLLSNEFFDTLVRFVIFRFVLFIVINCKNYVNNNILNALL